MQTDLVIRTAWGWGSSYRQVLSSTNITFEIPREMTTKFQTITSRCGLPVVQVFGRSELLPRLHILCVTPRFSPKSYPCMVVVGAQEVHDSGGAFLNLKSSKETRRLMGTGRTQLADQLRYKLPADSKYLNTGQPSPFSDNLLSFFDACRICGEN
jgi:hypothetical protein